VAQLTTSTRLKIAYAGLAATDAWLSGIPDRRAHLARFVTKPLLMPTLAASLATSPRAVGSPLRTTTLAAQVGGWGGDVALLGEGTGAFLAGTGSFALGHVAYLGGFVRRRNASPVATSPAARTVTAAWALTAPAMGVMARRTERGLGRPVLGYATMLATMVVGATHLDPTLSPVSRRLTAAGAGMFMLSDTLLGLRKFVLADPPAGLETAVMATYTTAQFLLSEGAARA
jgi:uncharacterized membrane protein YhhN